MVYSAIGRKKDLSPLKRGQIKDLLENTEIFQREIAITCRVTQSVVASVKKKMQNGSTGTSQRRRNC